MFNKPKFDITVARLQLQRLQVSQMRMAQDSDDLLALTSLYLRSTSLLILNLCKNAHGDKVDQHLLALSLLEGCNEEAKKMVQGWIENADEELVKELKEG